MDIKRARTAINAPHSAALPLEMETMVENTESPATTPVNETLPLYTPMRSRGLFQSVVLQAAHYAAMAHRTQRRKNRAKDPYINHPLSVAYFLSRYGNVENPFILAAAVLHDVIEDTETKEKQLREIFGDTITNIVLGGDG